LEKIYFHNEESGYTALQLTPDPGIAHHFAEFLNNKKTFTCVGTLLSPRLASHIRLTGNWTTHPKYGAQFHFQQSEEILPTSVEGIKKYLCSGIIKGVGNKLVSKIINTYGTDTLNILDNDPKKLLKIKGLGKKNYDRLMTSWNEHKGSRALLLFLQPFGINVGLGARIYKHYGPLALEKVQNNPYQLALDITGVSFELADNLGQSLGFAQNTTERFAAYIICLIKEQKQHGHLYVPLTTVQAQIKKKFEITSEDLNAILSKLVEQRRIVLEQYLPDTGFSKDIKDIANTGVYLTKDYLEECAIAQRLKKILHSPMAISIKNPKQAYKKILKKQSIQLAEEQIEALKRAATSKILIVTGGPGTGKTTIINSIIDLFKEEKAKIQLTAPTGRAARRMQEACNNMEAKTIHRLLEYSPNISDFLRDATNQLDCDLLVIDEASMLDNSLFYHLLTAVPKGATLLIVGDVYQLPSVGPGTVLQDLITSNVLPVVKLTKIFRQSAESAIIRNAHRINQGLMPLLNEQHTDFFFMTESEPNVCAQTICDLVAQRLPKYYGFDPIQDIQVLSPMHKGDVGITSLNTLLQERLNPNATAVCKGVHQFRINDKVMQIHNNYDKDVFNGDLGIITEVNIKEETLNVHFDEKDVEYNYSELEDLVLAYAISIHKSQGSEYPCVIIPLSTTHYWMLERNLIYTAVTRGKKIVVIIGEKQALNLAVSRNNIQKRYTRLALRLQTSPSMPLLENKA
ncbi:MAG: ATP-dependent RecD-like DNA helicase, partial [Desulfovibrio sp.]|nr:ATP-dependent RecD-like DNA helicase [Desulfovibrio sp.]